MRRPALPFRRVPARWLALTLATTACGFAGCTTGGSHGGIDTAAIETDPSTGADPRSDRARERAEAWKAAMVGIERVEDRWLVTEPIRTPATLMQDRATAAEMDLRNRRTEAVAAAVRAVRHAEAGADDWNRLADAFVRAGRLDEAEAATRTALRMDPADRVASRELAVAAARRGDHAAAIDHMERHLAFAPEDTEAMSRLATWNWYHGDVEDAWRWVRRAEDAGGSVPPQLRRMIIERRGGGR